MIAALTSVEYLFWVCICIVFIVLSGLFSGSETGLYCINQTRLRLAAYENDPAARRLQGLLTDRTALLFTTLLGTNLANYLAPICLTVLFLNTLVTETRAESEHLAELYTTLILTPIVFIFGEIVPKNLFQRDAERLMGRVSGLLRITHRVFQWTGIIWIQRRISDFALRRLHRQAPSGSILHTRLDVYQMLRESAATGALTLTQSSILERIHRLKSIPVGHVLVPLGRVIMLAAEGSEADVERILRRTKVSRLPVYRGNRRRIIGVVHVLDLLTTSAPQALHDRLQPPVEITAGGSVIDALWTLQQQRRRMAIV
ncbi:MAG: CNNM domain-containing protein, partial [Phycisphaerae bacterium]